ncbi:DsbA family protein [Rhodobacter sp. Har01]|uniref:DsbA family protein n=1 Tax=Rhodobacter sp. Har01 TaxID=2883999 RepID=UPI001D07A4AC|nr:DsbA family protein [Rhodobacter sp. Har01]MCB6177814.1 DsbA family protein [Rhodobacter sp. Har01]
MTTIHRRALLALAAAAAGLPAWAQETTTADPATGSAVVPDVKDFSLGDPVAPVKIVEYASYTCGHCAHFHETVFKPLKAAYIDTGKVYFTLREVYFDRYGLWAALVARCGGDLRYFGISDMIFSQQAEWAASQDPNVVIASLRTFGIAAGLTNEQLDVCLSDAAMVDAMVKRFETNMKADGIEGTPSLMINGEKHPNMSYDELKAILDPLLAG